MIGTTRSRVSFFMNRFRKLGFIEYNGRIRVHKSLLNVVLHDQLPEENAVSASLLDTLPDERESRLGVGREKRNDLEPSRSFKRAVLTSIRIQ